MYLRAIGRGFTQMIAYFLVMNSKRCIVNLVCRGDGRPVVRTVYLGTHRSYSLSGDSKNHNQNVRDRRKGYAYHCICRAHC